MQQHATTKRSKTTEKKEAGLLNGAKLRLLCHWVHQQRDGNTSLCCHGVLVVLHRDTAPQVVYGCLILIILGSL